jgi:hypothetical protein
LSNPCEIWVKKSPPPLFAKEGEEKGALPKWGNVTPFGKGRLGGILQINVLIILRLLIIRRNNDKIHLLLR